MSIELAIMIGGVVGMIIGIIISDKGREERDERIKELEGELTVKQNVIESQNDTIIRLRKKIKKKGYETDDCDN